MKLVLLALGTRGDVQPYLALGLGLKAAGHDPRLVTGRDFVEVASARGLPVTSLSADIEKLVRSEAGRSAIAGDSAEAVASLKEMLKRAREEAFHAVEDAEVILFHPVLEPFATAFSERLGCQLVRAVASVPVMSMKSEIKSLYGYSRHVLPPSPGWPAHFVMTGYWFLDPIDPLWAPPDELTRFMGLEPEPIYVGFGSMASVEPDRLTSIVLEALELSGLRAVLATGWGGLSGSDLPDSVFLLDGAPHDWLFPRVAAVVHHGGAGTVASGLRAGKPTVICPFAVDQPFWGQVVEKLGVGPSALPQERLTAELLAEAMRASVENTRYHNRARQLAAQIAAEPGVPNAVAAVETWFQSA